MHKIAILDNDVAASRMYAMKLQKHHFVVKTALDGWTGLRLITHLRPDLLIIDFHLPVITGVEIIERLLHFPLRNPKIIMSSNLDQEIVHRKSRHLPIDHYLTKVEHTPSELVQIVNFVLLTPI